MIKNPAIPDRFGGGLVNDTFFTDTKLSSISPASTSPAAPG